MARLSANGSAAGVVRAAVMPVVNKHPVPAVVVEHGEPTQPIGLTAGPES